MSVQPNLRAMPPFDDNLEGAVEEALEAMEPVEPPAPDPDPTPPVQPVSEIARARTSFANHLEQLRERIASANADAAAANGAIALASARLAEVERRLYQMNTLRMVIETAYATLAQARDE